TGNVVYNSGDGIVVSGAGAIISGNDVYATNYGITANGPAGGQILVEGNKVHDNYSAGIYATNYVLVTGNNIVYRQMTGYGIKAYYSGSQVDQNTVFDNNDGIYLYISVATNNTVFHNFSHGLYVDYYSTASGNTVYSNPVGIYARYGTSI